MAASAAPVCMASARAPAASTRRALRSSGARPIRASPISRSSLRVVAAAASKNYNITLLPGDGIGPEIMKVAREVLDEAGH